MFSDQPYIAFLQSDQSGRLQCIARLAILFAGHPVHLQSNQPELHVLASFTKLFTDKSILFIESIKSILFAGIAVLQSDQPELHEQSGFVSYPHRSIQLSRLMTFPTNFF